MNRVSIYLGHIQHHMSADAVRASSAMFLEAVFQFVTAVFAVPALRRQPATVAWAGLVPTAHLVLTSKVREATRPTTLTFAAQMPAVCLRLTLPIRSHTTILFLIPMTTRP